MTGVAVTSYAQGTYWPALWKTAGYKGNADDQRVWGMAFTAALAELGLPTFSDSNLRYVGPILMHAGIPAYCLGDFFRLLVDRRRQDPGLDADSFLAWATAPRRQLRLSQLDKPAARFLLNGGDYAHDIVDRTLDLLDRLTEPDPDFDAVRLPSYMIETDRTEQAAGRLDLTKATRSASNRTSVVGRRQAQPRIALDPYGQGVPCTAPCCRRYAGWRGPVEDHRRRRDPHCPESCDVGGGGRNDTANRRSAGPACTHRPRIAHGTRGPGGRAHRRRPG